MKWIKLVLLAALLLVGLASPSFAVCIPEKFAHNVQGQPPFYYTYIYMGETAATGAGFNGRFWQTGDYASANSNSKDPGLWFYNAAPGTDKYWYFYILVGYQTTGCVTGNMSVYVESPDSGRFFLWTQEEAVGASGEFNFDYATIDGSNGSFWNSATSPRPRIDSSSRSGGNLVNFNFTVPDPQAGVIASGDALNPGAVTGVNVYSQCAASQPSLGDLTGWTQVGTTLAGTGGSSSGSVDCSDTTLDCYLAAGLLVDGAAPSFLSTPAQIECDPNLADPKQPFKLLDREPRGRGRIQRSR